MTEDLNVIVGNDKTHLFEDGHSLKKLVIDFLLNNKNKEIFTYKNINFTLMRKNNIITINTINKYLIEKASDFVNNENKYKNSNDTSRLNKFPKTIYQCQTLFPGEEVETVITYVLHVAK